MIQNGYEFKKQLQQTVVRRMGAQATQLNAPSRSVQQALAFERLQNQQHLLSERLAPSRSLELQRGKS